MRDAKSILYERLSVAFSEVSLGADPVLRPSAHADFQVNGALALAKSLGRNPRELAESIVAGCDLTDVCEAVEVSGPGFINLRLSESFLVSQALQMASDSGLGVGGGQEGSRGRVVVDYSAPNVAKEMHVGHLRSSVIGDALCRLLEREGYDVIRENHVGDWGTPFGMLIEHLVDVADGGAVEELAVSDLDAFYREARTCFDSDEEFAERSRRRVVKLQSGDRETLDLWRLLVAESMRHFEEVYSRLGVLLTPEDVVGESYYNSMLDSLVEDLDDLGMLVEDDGAKCVFPPGFTNRDGEPLPLIIQKSDGGYGYAATDLAAIRDRVDDKGAKRILYVVGAPQAQHFAMCFAVARAAGWLPDDVEAVHVEFGNVLGSDRKMFKTRSGETVKLIDLLDEAVERAVSAISERGDSVSSGIESVARMLGIGAVKYADLSTERTRDYMFDWERMLAFEGNTGPYLQYAHARIRSIFRKGGVEGADVTIVPVIRDERERALLVALVGFGAAVSEAVATYSPSKLCAYLFDLATTFTSFYEGCPVLNAPDAESRGSRMLYCEMTARVLADGLGLLGIEAPEQM
ncbi:MAG: arginine--tRNA ligase [Acidimicrobiales bacterium]